jgi:hypothetical protein
MASFASVRNVFVASAAAFCIWTGVNAPAMAASFNLVVPGEKSSFTVELIGPGVYEVYDNAGKDIATVRQQGSKLKPAFTSEGQGEQQKLLSVLSKCEQVLAGGGTCLAIPAQGLGQGASLPVAGVDGGVQQQTGSNPSVGSEISNVYVITSFTQTKSLTEIHVKPSSIIPAAEIVIKFDTGRKASVIGVMLGGAAAGQGGTMNNSNMDLVWINGKTNTGTNKATAINFAAYKGVMDCIHEYVNAGHAPSDFDSKRLERLDKAMEYKAR